MLKGLVRPRQICDSARLQTGVALTCDGSGRAHERGPRMSGTQLIPPLTTYRAEVAWLMEQGETFDTVEHGIDRIDDLTEDEKAALWLFAFSLRDPRDQQREARGHLAAVE
jgi:hypothetical protein